MSNKCIVNCAVCTEKMDPTDLQLKPCDCGYEICVWCWNHIIQIAEQNDTVGRCPACRAPYDKERILRTTINIERLAKQDSQKHKLQKTKSKQLELPEDLDTVRVIRRNLVYVSGVPVTLAEEKTLKKREYFGQYGKIIKVVLVPAAEAFLNSRVVYITFSKVEEAIRCMEAVDGFILDGCSLKACFGTTRYCRTWLKNRRCNRPNCLYVHDVCTQEDICTKDDVASACSSKLQKSSGYAPSDLPPRSGSMLPPPMDISCSRSNNGEKPLPQSSAHKHFKNGKMQPEKGDDRKYSALPPTASWASTPTPSKLSYVSETVSQGAVAHSHVPSNFVCKATDAGAQIPPPFQNISRIDEQISKSRYSMTMTNELVNDSALDQQHIATRYTEHTGLRNFWGSDQAQVHAPCHSRLCEYSDKVLPKLLNKTNVNTVYVGNSYGISTSSTGTPQILDSSDVRSSKCAVGYNSLLRNQGELPNSSYADEDFNLQRLGYLSYSHIPPLLKNSTINGNIGDSPEADRKEHDITSDVLALDLALDDHLIGPSLARHFADNGRNDCPIICDCKTARNRYKSTNALHWMDNLDHAKTNFIEPIVFNVERYDLLDDAKGSATNICTCHMDNGPPALQVKEHRSFNSQHSLFSTDDSNKSKSLFFPCQSALTSKLKGIQLSAIPAEIKSIPPGQVSDDPDPPFPNTSNSGYNFCSWEINNFNHHMPDDYATGNLFRSGESICPRCAPSISIDLIKSMPMPLRLGNFVFNSVTSSNECTSTINNMHWQNRAHIYDGPWGSSSMGGRIPSGSEVTERSLPEIINSLNPGSEYAPLR